MDCPTHLVPDAPADTDAFGAHGRIAGAIGQLITTSAGGKSIGLLGTWGAGKSTVVEILRGQLERDPRFVVWMFDAWAHEGDSLRRMFLESLTQRLAEKGWLTGHEWTERLEILAKRRKVVEQSNTPRLSPLAIWLAASLLLVPVGLELWSSRLGAGLGLNSAWPVDWAAVVALLGTFAPPLVLLAYMAGVLLRGGSIADLRRQLPAALTLFVRQTDTSSRTETLDSGEPTSLEFERVFCQVMQAALTPADQIDPDRRLVLVVDNLDRVGAEQGLSMWSTLQTFVHHRETREPWLDRLWCLLPFDGDAIRRLWPADGAQGINVAESFLDKTFQVRFEVPLPLLSDWKDYVMARLKEAMPSHSDDDFFRIYRLYAVRRTPATPAPTPRELKLFVNQVGSLHRQWQDEIPLPDLAYYALLQRDKVPITADSIGQLPDAGEAGLVSDRVRQHLAAVAYGVSIASAQELLLKEPIMQALEAADAQALKTLSSSDDAFWLVLEQAIWRGCEEWPTAEGGKLLHAVAALEESQITAHEPSWRVDQWFGRIEAATTRVGNWAPMDAKAVDGILSLSRRHAELAERLFLAFVVTRTNEASWGSGSSMRAFVDDFSRLTSGLQGSITNARVVLPGDFAAYVRFAGELVRRDPEGRLWASFPPSPVAVAELNSPSFSFDADAVAAIQVIRAASPEASWGTLTVSAERRLQQAAGEDRIVLQALNALWDEPDAIQVLQKLATEGPALQWLTSASGKGSRELEAAWLYTIARFEPGLEQILAAPAHDSSGAIERLLSRMRLEPEWAEQFARTVLEMGHAEVIFEVAQRCWDARSPMLSALEKLAAMGPPARVLHPRLLLEQWSLSFSGADPYGIARLLCENSAGAAQLLSVEPFSLDLGSLYAGALDAEGADVSALVTRSVEALGGLHVSTWERSLSSDAGLGRLVESLSKRGAPVTLDAAAGEALRRLAPKLAQSGLSIAGDPGRKATLNALEPSVRAEVLNAVFESLPRASQTDVGRLLSLVDESVFETTRLVEYPDAVVAAARYILERLNDNWLMALSRAVARQPDLGSRLSMDARAQLFAEIESQQLQRTSDSARAALADLAAALAGSGSNEPGGPATAQA